MGWGLPKPRNAVDGRRVGEDAAGHDARGRHPVRPDGGVAALGHRPVRDVRVRAQQVVGLDVPEHEGSVGAEPRPDVDLGRVTANCLECLLQGQDQAHRPARPQGHEGHERLELRVLLAAEPAAGVRSEHPDLRQRQAQDLRQDALQPVRVLDRCSRRRSRRRPGAAMNAWGSMAKWVTIGNVHVFSTTRSADAATASTSPQPKWCSRRTFVPASGSPGRRAGSCTSGADGSSAAAIVKTAGSSSYCDLHEGGGPFGSVLRVGGHGRHGLPVVLRLVDRQDRAVLELGPEARHRLGQVGRGHRRGGRRGPGERRSCRWRRCGHGRSRASTSFAWSTSAQVDVGHVLLAAGHPVEPSQPGRGAADRRRAHRSSASAAARTASVICW